MKAINTLKTELIDKILTIDDQELLKALDTLVNLKTSEGIVKLTDEQKAMLHLSEEDIKYSRLTAQDKLDEEDMKWLSEL